MSLRRTGLFLVFGCLCLLPFHGTAQKKEDKPNGPVIADGNRITWEGWTFNWSIHPRNGLVIENVAFHGKSVLKYAGLAEIFVPYNRGQPRPEDFAGGIGDRMVALLPGKDCIPGSIGCMAFNEKGKEEGRRVVMLHEESTGLAYVGNLGRAYGKMLVLWGAYNMDGYFYISRWRFRSDGCLMPEIGLTGPLQHTDFGRSSEYGSMVGKGRIFAPSHVHNIYYCLDLDIDGTENVVEEFNYQQDKPGSLSGKHSWTPIKKETSRPGSAENFRTWRVVNPKSKNDLGLPRSYELIPGGTGIYRGGEKETFAQAELWVTKHNPKEHPNDNRPLSVALPSYLNNEDVEGQNVVLWYALHLHHLPRTEDWPGMPVDWAGFTLKPRDFLDRSPVISK